MERPYKQHMNGMTKKGTTMVLVIPFIVPFLYKLAILKFCVLQRKHVSDSFFGIDKNGMDPSRPFFGAVKNRGPSPFFRGCKNCYLVITNAFLTRSVARECRSESHSPPPERSAPGTYSCFFLPDYC
jgi:hypothetical protein